MEASFQLFKGTVEYCQLAVFLRDTACAHDCRSRLKIFCRKVPKELLPSGTSPGLARPHPLVLSIIADIVNHESAVAGTW